MVFEYEVVNAIMVGISLLYFVCMMSVEESPVYYEMKNREKDAAISYAFYRNVEENNVKSEMNGSLPIESKEKSFSIRDLCKYWNQNVLLFIFFKYFIYQCSFERKSKANLDVSCVNYFPISNWINCISKLCY